MNRTEKEQVVADLHAQFEAVQGAVLTDFRHLNVREITKIRRAFREAGVSFRVVKNTLAKRAAQGTPMAMLQDDFVGTTAIAYSLEDVTEPARIAHKCSKDQEKFVLKSGLLDGRRLDEKEVVSLANLPTQDELRANLLRLLLTPATQLAQVLQAVPQKVVLALSAYQDKLTSEQD